MDENVFGERYLTPEENLKKQEMYRNMSENIFQLVINKDEKTGQLITNNKVFEIIKEENSDSWKIILDKEKDNEIVEYDLDKARKERKKLIEEGFRQKKEWRIEK